MAAGHFVSRLTDTTKKSTVSHVNPETGKVHKGIATDAGYSAPPAALAGSSSIPGGVSVSGGGAQSSEDETADQNCADPDSADDQGNGTGGNGSTRDTPSASGLESQSGDSATVFAKSKVRNKNKEKDKAKVQLSIGNPLVAAGMTFNLLGCGQFDGKYFIEAAHHTVGPEYKTELTVRRCLKGL
jgi:hypothetical protein